MLRIAKKMRGSVLLSTKHEAQSVVLDTPVRGGG